MFKIFPFSKKSRLFVLLLNITYFDDVLLKHFGELYILRTINKILFWHFMGERTQKTKLITTILFYTSKKQNTHIDFKNIDKIISYLDEISFSFIALYLK